MEKSSKVADAGDRSFVEEVNMKLADTGVPGFIVTCSPEECEIAGAFVEDALSASEALDAVDELSFNNESGDGL